MRADVINTINFQLMKDCKVATGLCSVRSYYIEVDALGQLSGGECCFVSAFSYRRFIHYLANSIDDGNRRAIAYGLGEGDGEEFTGGIGVNHWCSF